MTGDFDKLKDCFFVAFATFALMAIAFAFGLDHYSARLRVLEAKPACHCSTSCPCSTPAK